MMIVIIIVVVIVIIIIVIIIIMAQPENQVVLHTRLNLINIVIINDDHEFDDDDERIRDKRISLRKSHCYNMMMMIYGYLAPARDITAATKVGVDAVNALA